jgi:hypothetical protein
MYVTNWSTIRKPYMVYVTTAREYGMHVHIEHEERIASMRWLPRLSACTQRLAIDLLRPFTMQVS